MSNVRYPDLGDQARTKWSNLPAASRPRAGVALGDFSESQRVLLHDLLRASTSSQGYHKLTGAMRAEEVLHDLRGGRAIFSPAYYYTSVFGSPEDANWAWMLTGHHMSAMFTVAGDRTAFTPMFTGSQPLQIPNGLYAGWQVLPQDAARAGELLAALSSDQQRVAIIGDIAPDDVVAGPGRQQSLASFQGIPAGQLDAGQQRLLWLLVQEFVCNADFDAAEAQLALVQERWDETHFSWIGPPPDPSSALLLPGARSAHPDRVQRAGAAGERRWARPRDHPRPGQRLRRGLAGAALPGVNRSDAQTSERTCERLSIPLLVARSDNRYVTGCCTTRWERACGYLCDRSRRLGWRLVLEQVHRADAPRGGADGVCRHADRPRRALAPEYT